MQAEVHAIRIADDFSETPFGRYVEDGPESGQVFREKILLPALAEHGSVVLILDGVEGLPSSFWEEVMGGMIREGWELSQLKSRVHIEAEEPELQTYVRLGWRYAEEEAAKQRQ